MEKRRSQLPGLLNRLRWAIPALMVALGLGYTLLDYWLIAPTSDIFIYLLSKILIIGIIGPTLALLLLSWAARVAQSRQQAGKTLERRARQLEIASQVSQKVTAILNVDKLLVEVVRLIQEQFGYYQVHLFLVDSRTNEIVLQECSGHAEESLMARGLRLKIGEEGITGWVAQTGCLALHNDVSQEPRYHAHELLPETRAELAIPLLIGQKVLGVLDVQSERKNAFEEEDLTILQLLGDQVAIAIENANLFQETRRQFQIMRALHDISLHITSQLESKQVLATILEQAVNLLAAQGSALAVLDPPTDMIRTMAIHNLPPAYEGVKLRLGEGVTGQVVSSGSPLIINDYQHWSGRSSHFWDSPYDAILSVPLRSQGQVYGALSVLDRGERRPFTDDDIQLLSLFADLASIALKNAELYEQIVQLSQQLEQKVDQRTEQLVRAREEIAHKATQLQQLLATTVHVQEEERMRIAQDLHDGSNQLITGILFEIQAAQESIHSQQQTAALAKLKTAKELLRQIEVENRHIISGLRPPLLDSQGLIPALEWLANDFRTHYPVECLLRISGGPVRLSPEAEIMIYRLTQEALNNVVTHAQAQSVQIRIVFEPARLCLIIWDDGVGFDHKQALLGTNGRIGLIGMIERAQGIGGQLEIKSIPGQGSRVRLSVPLSKP